MIRNELVSVIIPTFNRAKKISRSIESVLNQTYSNFEIIIVDDNSSDSTKEVVASFNDNRIRYIKLNSNYGACHARNIGIKCSKGNYIAFQDSDDEWLNSKLKRQLTFLKKNNLDVVSCKMRRFFSNSIEDIFPKDLSLNNIVYGNKISTQTIFGKKECFEDENFDERLPRFQDWELILRILKKYKVQIMDETLVKTYLQSDNNISKDTEKAIVALRIIAEKFQGNRKVESAFLRTLARYEKQSGQHYRKDLFKAFKRDPLNIKLVANCLLSFFPNNIQDIIIAILKSFCWKKKI